MPYREVIRRISDEYRFPVLVVMQGVGQSYTTWYSIATADSPLLHDDSDTREHWLIRLMRATTTKAFNELR